MPNNSVFSVVNVLETVEKILVKTNFNRQEGKSTKVIYKGTTDMCNLQKLSANIKIFQSFINLLQNNDSGNFTYSCPLKRGVYVVTNIHVDDDSPILRFAYSPKSVFNLRNMIYKGLPGGKTELLQDYQLNGTIIKKC